jgi:hypothetical protein
MNVSDVVRVVLQDLHHRLVYCSYQLCTRCGHWLLIKLIPEPLILEEVSIGFYITKFARFGWHALALGRRRVLIEEL